MSSKPTWKIKEIVAYTAECPHCQADLLDGHDYACWVQREGVEESLEMDFCPRCDKPISARGYEAQEEEA